MATILLVGATSMVGGHVLARLLADERVERVISPTRKTLPPHAKLLAPLVDFARLPMDADLWQVEGAICALGTTRVKAGTSAERRAVDHDYPLAVARRVRAHGATRFALTSSMGADPCSRFLYTRMKGELEGDLAALGFASLTLVRPGLIGGNRREFRAAERATEWLLDSLGPLLPRRYRISPAFVVAQVLIEAAVAGKPGRYVVGSDQLALGKVS